MVCTSHIPCSIQQRPPALHHQHCFQTRSSYPFYETEVENFETIPEIPNLALNLCDVRAAFCALSQIFCCLLYCIIQQAHWMSV